MITPSANRLLLAAMLCTGVASIAQGAGPSAAQSEAGGRTPSSAIETIPNATPDADANMPDAPDQVFSYYTVAGATMRGRSSTVETAYAGLGCIYMTAGADLLVNSDLPIPDGSLIKYLRIYYHDTNAANGVGAFLTRYTPGAQASDLTSVASTAAFAAGYGTSLSPEINELVDGDVYAYTVIGWPNVAASSNQICGVRVAYYGPDFFSNGFEDPL